jgi:plasmid stabilization system protein ParE
MKYRVIYAPSFRQDVRDHVAYLHREKVSAATIERWFSKLFDLVDSLDEWPKRFAVDPIESNATGRETRKVNLDDYLIFYQVDDEQQQVNVVGFMHGARRR